jgi:hypothetical protein
LQFEVLDLVNREDRLAQTITNGADRAFEVHNVCVKRMSHGLGEAPLRQKSDSKQPWKDGAGHGSPYSMGCCSIQKRCRQAGMRPTQTQQRPGWNSQAAAGDLLGLD